MAPGGDHCVIQMPCLRKVIVSTSCIIKLIHAQSIIVSCSGLNTNWNQKGDIGTMSYPWRRPCMQKLAFRTVLAPSKLQPNKKLLLGVVSKEANINNSGI